MAVACQEALAACIPRGFPAGCPAVVLSAGVNISVAACCIASVLASQQPPSCLPLLAVPCRWPPSAPQAPTTRVCPGSIALHKWTVGVPTAPNTASRQSLSGACLVQASGPASWCAVLDTFSSCRPVSAGIVFCHAGGARSPPSCRCAQPGWTLARLMGTHLRQHAVLSAPDLILCSAAAPGGRVPRSCQAGRQERPRPLTRGDQDGGQGVWPQDLLLGGQVRRPRGGLARRPSPLLAALQPSPLPCGSDSGDMPQPLVSTCPACSMVNSRVCGCAHSTQSTFTSVMPRLPTWSKLWGAWCLHKVFPCLYIALSTRLPQALW